ncbi:MAG: hypothetical protein IIT68_09375 [Treponema sp.]|nr:hypothetical protein [Treponema sp.]
MKKFKQILTYVAAGLLLVGVFFYLQNKGSVQDLNVTASAVDTNEIQNTVVLESNEYDDKDSVTQYIILYNHLPSNYITKAQAEKLGWQGGGLEEYAPGKSIGGDRFSNREGLLPKQKGRTYTECDIDTRGKKSRGAKRIVFSNDGLVYYTEDHYESFELLYGDE